MQRWTAGGEAAQGYPATSDERRQYLGQLFADPLNLLKKVVGLIGDGDVRREFPETESHAVEFKEAMEARIAARNARFR